jgi:phosphate:Na+ symporter
MLTVLLHLAGGVAMLTWGLHMVESGVMRAYGTQLRHLMGNSLGNRFKAFAAGLAVTGALQSSTATALIATSFAARNLMGPVTGLAVMLGANVGSTLIVQAFSLNLSWISPLCLIVGMWMFERGKGSRSRDLGRALIGLGLMLLALALMVQVMRPAEGAPELRTVLGALSGQPILNAALAAGLTWAAHSSIPVMLFVMSIASSHAIPMDSALAMVLGINIGSTLNPYMQGLKGGDNVRRRLPTGNLLLRAGVCLVLLAFCSPLSQLLEHVAGDPGHLVVDLHTGLNLAIALLFIGLLDPIARWLEKLLPDNTSSANPDAPRYLDPALLASPSVALACATREALHMGDIVEEMLRASMPTLLGGDRQKVVEICRRDNAVDQLHEAIKLYVTRLMRESLTEAEAHRALTIIAFVINLEHVGDIIDKNLMELASKKIKGQLRFSEEGERELVALFQCVLDCLHQAQAAFVSSDAVTAQKLLDSKDEVRTLERAAADNHLQRLRDGRAESISSSSLHVDVVRDLKRIHSHICAVAYPVLEQAGVAQTEGASKPALDQLSGLDAALHRRAG